MVSVKSVYLKPKMVKAPHSLFWHLVTTVIPVTFHHIHSSCKTLALCISLFYHVSCWLIVCVILWDAPDQNYMPFTYMLKMLKKDSPCSCTCRFQKAFLRSISPWVLSLFGKLIFLLGNPETGHLTIFAYSDTWPCCMCDISCNMFELESLAFYVTFVLACTLQDKYCHIARKS